MGELEAGCGAGRRRKCCQTIVVGFWALGTALPDVELGTALPDVEHPLDDLLLVGQVAGVEVGLLELRRRARHGWG